MDKYESENAPPLPQESRLTLDPHTSSHLMADVLIVGTGLAGLTAAIASADAGFETIAIGPVLDTVRAARDTRTTALFSGSIEMLRNLGLWDEVGSGAAPLAAIRLVDDTRALWRAPEVLFHARELKLESFGYNFENAALLLALQARAARQRHLRILPGEALPVLDGDGATIQAVTAGGQRMQARLIVAADGRNSVFREAAGIGIRHWRYPQVAITLRFRHARPHDDVSIELHRPAGPLTTVPLTGRASSLVWVETPQEAARIVALADGELAALLEERLQGALGTIDDIGPRARFPLSGLVAHRFGARRIALIGETAHAFPPIGAQGLNLSYRDIATLLDELTKAHMTGADIGSDDVLSRYDAARRPDVETRTLMVDLLNRSLYAGILPLHMMRGAGLHAIKAFRPLKDLAMRQGLHPAGPIPRLMRPADAV